MIQSTRDLLTLFSKLIYIEFLKLLIDTGFCTRRTSASQALETASEFKAEVQIFIQRTNGFLEDRQEERQKKRKPWFVDAQEAIRDLIQNCVKNRRTNQRTSQFTIDGRSSQRKNIV